MAAIYTPTPSQMVNETDNIIKGYARGGPIRALAQEPPQNSLDAKAPGSMGPVRVEYRLHRRTTASGDTMYLLTVTDENTTGLRGPVLSFEEILDRSAKDDSIHEDENWAAWEAMGYPKMGPDSRGSRGQGKAALLHHSRYHDGNAGRMGVLYDTLLPDGTYRMGVRRATPFDVVRRPVFEGDEARRVVQGWLDDDGWKVPLLLEPLNAIGTRVIVPNLSDEALDAFLDGQLVAWLQRLWWRPIQLGELEIAVIDESGALQRVEPPSFWAGEPWKAKPLPVGEYLQEHIPLPVDSDLQIKRVVMRYDPSLPLDDMPDWAPHTQFGGLQLLRRGQWIETLGTKGEYADYIPAANRGGFRGFVEFDLKTDRELRKAELPQHDAFDRRYSVVKQIIGVLDDCVREFADQQGWLKTKPKTVPKDYNADWMLRRVSDMFLSSNLPGNKPKEPTILIWSAALRLEYPQRGTTRADYGQKLRGIEVVVDHEPQDRRRDVSIKVMLIGPDAVSRPIGERSVKTADGRGSVSFPDIEIVKVVRQKGQVAFPQDGKYRLVAECWHDGTKVKEAVRNVFVRVDPPTRSPRAIAVDIAVTNISSGERRVNDAEQVTIGITVINRGTDDRELTVDASLEQMLLADGVPLQLEGRAPGDAPHEQMLTFPGVTIYTVQPADLPSGMFVVLDPGMHYIRADVLDEEGEVVAYASRAVFVQSDPPGSAGGPPFRVEAREEEGLWPLWELKEEDPLWVLRWYGRHPAYEAAQAAEQAGVSSAVLSGRRFFWADVYCGALVDWALQLYDRGDQGGLKLLVERPDRVGDEVWQRYQDKIEVLRDAYHNKEADALAVQREVVALMLYILRREGE